MRSYKDNGGYGADRYFKRIRGGESAHSTGFEYFVANGHGGIAQEHADHYSRSGKQVYRCVKHFCELVAHRLGKLYLIDLGKCLLYVCDINIFK